MAQDTSATQTKLKPTYLQMCILHMDQHLADLRNLQAQASKLYMLKEKQQIVEIINKVQLAREELFLAQESLGRSIDHLEKML